MSSLENNQTRHGEVDDYNIRSGIEGYNESESSPGRDDSTKDHNMNLRGGHKEDFSRSLQDGSTEYFSMVAQDGHGEDFSRSVQGGSTEDHSMTGQDGHGEDFSRFVQGGSTEDPSMTGQDGNGEDLSRSVQGGSTEDHSMTGQDGHEEDFRRSVQGGSTEDHSMTGQDGHEEDFSRSVQGGSTDDHSMTGQDGNEEDFRRSVQGGSTEDHSMTGQDGLGEDLSRSVQGGSTEDHSMIVDTGSEDFSRSMQSGSTEYRSMFIGGRSFEHDNTFGLGGSNEQSNELNITHVLDGSNEYNSTSSTTVAVRNQTANLVATIGIKSRKDTQTPAIWGIAKVHTTYAVVSDHSNKSVKVIDTRDLRVTSEKRISHADFVWSLTSVNDNQIAVSVGTRGVVKILFFSVSTSGIISGTDKMIGVDCCFDDMVFSKNRLYGTYAKAIHVISMQGRKIRTITSSSFGWLYGIALSNDQSTIYVTSYDNHKVISMDLEGTVKATYTDLNQPCGITVDSLGYVYVCSSGKRSVHQLSADLNKKQIIIQNVDSKHCTFNNTENRLYLECLDTLKVFDMC